MASSNPNLDQLVQRLLSTEYAKLVRWATARFGEWVAEDAVAFAFAQLALGKMQRDNEKPVAWLRVVAKNEALRLLDAARENKPQIDSLDDVAEQSSSDDPALATEQFAQLGLLDQLTESQREALLLFAAGLTYKEIQAELGWTYTKVNRSITEGRAKLRKLIEGGEL